METGEQYPGEPSTRFLEEKLKLSQVIINMRKLEEAIPLLNEIYEEQSKQADTLLSHKLQMKELITFEELGTKFTAFSLEMDTKTMKKLKFLQNSITEIIQSKVNETDFKKTIKDKVNVKDHDLLYKKVKELENDTIINLK